MTEVVANESLIDFIKNYPDGVSIYAYGDYNNETNAIDIEWYTDYEAEVFDVCQSDDNESYTLVSEVSDADSYQYVITEDFETKYFKVSIPNDFGETIESVPFVVTKTEDGYSVDFLDSDGDGLPDIYENMIGTDLNNPDTDGDGLTDYQEVYITGTDPTKYDSVTEGVSDADADSDGDGLSNEYEIELGTDPKYADTDDDGLSDGDEINIYNTDPLNPDTDEDGVNDGDEIVLGLDPLKPDTDDNGVLDCDEYLEQTVDQSRFDSELFEDNLAAPSLLTVSAKGNVNSNIDISEYTGHLKGEERVYVGKVIEITNSEINSGSLSFTLSEDYTVKSYELAGELTNGLLICYNDGENTTPLATTYDEETRTLSADISAEGIYFVLDVISWLESLGLDIPSETSVEAQPSVQTFAARAVSDAAASIATVQIKGQVDIVFVIDTTGSMSGYISNVKNNITAFVNEIESAGITPSFALVDYRDITCDGENSTNTKKNPDGDNWFKNADDFKAEIAKLTVDGGGDIPETAIDALEMARQLNLRTSSQKFFVLVTDAGYKIDNNYGIKSMSEMIDLLVDDDINVSVVSNSSYQSTYKSLYESTGGIFANVGGNFKDELLSIADMINEETNSGCWIALNGLVPQIVKLDERPVWNGTADTDKDSLLDREELKSVWPTKYIDVVWYLYPLGLPLDYEYPSIPAYEYFSDPTKKDTDYDGINDYDDELPLSNTFLGKINSYYDSSDVKYVFDLRNFLKKPDKYNNELSATSLIFSNTIYNSWGFSYNKGYNGDISDIEQLLSLHGFKETSKYNVESDDDNVSEICVGYQNITSNGKSITVIAVVIRGTNGIREWSSNVDMGNPDSWDKDIHKGFYNTEQKIKEYLVKYVEDNKDKFHTNVAYWITGHSRGAALANVLSADLINENQTVFGYTFAAPNTTIASDKNSSKYNSVFNIKNKSDIITYLPLAEWGFGTYGINIEKDIQDSKFKKTWCNYTGRSTYNAFSEEVIEKATNRINKSCASSWEEAYEFAGKQNISDSQYEMISERAKRYCKIEERTKLFSGEHKGYALYPTTMFVFQLGIEIYAGNKEEKNNAKELLEELVNSKYSVALVILLGEAYLSGLPDTIDESVIGDGHAPISYFVLAEYDYA